MDLSMPVMDGIESTRRVAAELPGIRIIALSMFDSPDDVVELHQAGAALFLSKAGPAEDLIAAVRGHAVPGLVSMENQAKVRVLLADDHTMMRQVLASTLEHEADIEVVGEASNGLEVLDLCRTMRPDVVIMDLSMPIMDGIEATRRIATELPGIRVIALSMFDDPSDVVELHQAGAALFLSKSGPAEDLIAAVRGRTAPRREE